MSLEALHERDWPLQAEQEWYEEEALAASQWDPPREDIPRDAQGDPLPHPLALAAAARAAIPVPEPSPVWPTQSMPMWPSASSAADMSPFAEAMRNLAPASAAAPTTPFRFEHQFFSRP